MKKTKWNIFATIFIAVQALIVIGTIITIAVVNIFPALYLAAMAVVLVLLLALEYPMMYCRINRKKTNKKKVYIKRSIGTTIASISMIVCIIIIYVLAELGLVMTGITRGSDQVVNIIGVYVMADDDAETLSDAKDYTFGYAKSYDSTNTATAIEDIEEELGSSIETEEYASVLTAIDALYAGEVDALIMNEAYEGVLDNLDNYADFTDQTKILYEDKIVTYLDGSSAEVTEECFVVYLAGNDTRNEKLTTSRNDVNILAAVNPNTHQILLISTPRDAYVPTTASEDRDRDKLTHCGIYGIDCSVSTLEELYDIEIAYYAQINFTGFETLIDDIDGVTVYNEKTVYTHHNNYYLEEGNITLSGAEALDFCRDRYSYSDGDLARSRHEMEVIEAIISKCTSGKTVLSHYGDIMSDLTDMFITNMSTDDMQSLVKMQLSDMASWEVYSYTLDGTYTYAETYSMPGRDLCVYEYTDEDVEFVQGLFDKILNDKKLTDSDMTREDTEE